MKTKKLCSILVMLSVLLIVIPISLYSKEIKIDTKYGKKTIIVPEDRVSLEKAYLETIKNYIEAESDNTTLMEQNKIITNNNIELKDQLLLNQKKVNELLIVLQDKDDLNKTKLFRTYANFNLLYFVLNNVNYISQVQGQIQFGVLIYDKVNIQAGILIPDLAISLGVGFFLN